MAASLSGLKFLIKIKVLLFKIVLTSFMATQVFPSFTILFLSICFDKKADKSGKFNFSKLI